MIFDNYTIRSARPEDTHRCFEIETVSYQGEEAATCEKIAKRITTYPDGFMVIEIDGQIIGFINSGSCDQVIMSDESFKELIGHDPNGKHNVIMSVVVHPDFQGKSISSILMHNYILRMRKLQKESIYLMCSEQNIALYEKFGFRYQKESDSSHGGMSWHEMVLSL
ncbi:GNAT family N-acetyltransferase [Zooshikella sp. RANM57]|uniref:GNAT family N-acetyltransferase n=1 Tax=Zooshikella sp. RANM57 TaxID=3425863 RepID=UPI003D6EE229